MILAAGLGTRLKPFTDKHPKALAVVNGKTLLQRNIEYLKVFGISDIIINVHHFAPQIIDFLSEHNNFNLSIKISDETNEVLETGGGIRKASHFFDDGNPFLVMNVDILTQLSLPDFFDFYQKEKPIACLAVSERNSSRCLLFDDENTLCGWRNKNTNEVKMSRSSEILNEKSFSGIHIIQPQIFEMMPKFGKFSIVDTYLEVAKNQPIKCFNHSSILVDVGKPESIHEAEKYFA